MALQSFLSPLNFKFNIKKLPDFVEYVQDVNFPYAEAGRTSGFPNPFQTLDVPGEHMTFGDLSVAFKINDGMSNWLEIFEWIQGIGKPTNFQQYKNLFSAAEGEGVEVDANLIILNSSLEPSVRFDFINLYPYKLSGFTMSSTLEEVEYITASVEFAYRQYTYTIL